MSAMLKRHFRLVTVVALAAATLLSTLPVDSSSAVRRRVVRRGPIWTEISLNADSRGRKLSLELSAGKAQLDWAEVVFENGEAQVVDFAEKTHGPGIYALLDFRDGRRVDHVRMVARAKRDEARIALLMEK